MNYAYLAARFLTLLALIGLLIAEYRSSQLGVWLTKPVASLGFVLAALGGGLLTTAYGRWVLAGLCLCALGDVLLIPRGNGKAFLLGMVSFALGHLAYACGFIGRGLQLTAAALAFMLMAAVITFTWRWLEPRLPADMRLAVRGYMAIITLMVAAACGASVHTQQPWLAAGAVAFAISDLSVARERFVKPGFGNLWWGLPLYYVAQFLLMRSY